MGRPSDVEGRGLAPGGKGLDDGGRETGVLGLPPDGGGGRGIPRGGGGRELITPWSRSTGTFTSSDIDGVMP